MDKEILKAAFEAGAELYYNDNDGRTTMAQSLLTKKFGEWYAALPQADVIKSVCSTCNDTGWYKNKKGQHFANKCDCGK